ncbi:MAG: M48 family metalloprotease, partial [Planctomycetes bacterium]|nr:M48 family metalloprotease [Planctomycetota bacterium]
MQRLLEKLSLAIFVASSLATFLAALMPEVAQEAVVLGCAAAWAAAAVVIAVPYCARFKASLADHVWVAGALAGLLVLPLLPFLLWERPASHPFFFLTLILGPLIGSGARRAFRAQGRYFGSDRELPELTGEPRRHAEAVLERAGLRAASFRVESLGSFNAAVQGLRRCIVMVDRRAAESLPPAELAAMVAHEAGHVRYGGMLPYFAVAPVALAAASFAAPLWAEGDRLAPLLLYLPGLIVLQTAVRQLLEIACDRRAARWTSPGDVGRLLVKLHADQPALVQRVTQGWLAVPFVSHPPLRVRLAAFGEGAARDLVRYRSIWTFVVLCFFVAPFALLAAGAAAGVSLPEPFRAAAVALPVAFAVLHGLCWTRGAR